MISQKIFNLSDASFFNLPPTRLFVPNSTMIGRPIKSQGRGWQKIRNNLQHEEGEKPTGAQRRPLSVPSQIRTIFQELTTPARGWKNILGAVKIILASGKLFWEMCRWCGAPWRARGVRVTFGKCLKSEKRQK